jgi:aspartyl-tRNA(Asn)/glutamyl-tRNA(Gln) amidotransferase subunit C
MPTITREDVLRVAALARLELGDDDVALFADQLARILDYADTVRQVDTTGVAAVEAMPGDGVRWRQDVPTPSLPREAALAAAPDASRDAGLFRVPKVL